MRVSPLLSSVLAVACLGAAGVLAWGGSLDLGAETPTALAASPSPSASASESPSPIPTPSATVPVAPVPADRGSVQADLGLLLADPEYDTLGLRSVVVLDEVGRVVIEQSPTLGVLPASTMKLVTAAAALTLHGGDGRLSTRVLVDGTVSSRGTLDGDVIVVAGGDPTLSTVEYQRFVYPARPASDTAQIVQILRAAGIERITGDVIVDPGAFADQRTPDGWRDVYLSDFDARNITGLTVDAGLSVTVEHPMDTWNDLKPEDLEDGGIRIMLSPDPVVHAAAVLREEFARARMSVEGTGIVGSTPDSATEIGSIQSPTIAEMLTFMTKQSDNHIADTLMREIGASVSGRSTWDSSAAAERDLLGGLGLDLEGAVIEDGSGLSRDDVLTARMLASLDQIMSASDHGDVWASLQAVAGRDGTLRGRLANTIASGRFRGKTGTLNDVRALVGAVEGPDGRRYHLAVIGNGGEVWRASTLTDQIILRLTRSLWCGVEDPPTDVLLACAA